MMRYGYKGPKARLDMDAVIENDRDTSVLDERERDDLLMSMLHEHPNAFVEFLDDDGRIAEQPPSIELFGQQRPPSQSALDLIAPSSHLSVIANLDGAKRFGTARADVQLVNGAEASCHLIDVRHRHGVFVGFIVPMAGSELLASLAEPTPPPPRSGRVEKDGIAVFTAVDDRICQILGFEPDELIGQRSIDLLHPDDHGRAIAAWLEMLSRPGWRTRTRARHRRKDGSWVWMELTNLNAMDGDDGCVITEMLDISDEMEALENLRQREELLTRLTESLPSGVLHVGLDRSVITTNEQLHRVLGVERHDTVDEQLASVVDTDRPALDAALRGALVDGRRADLEVALVHRVTGARHRCAVSIRVLTDGHGAPTGAVMCIDDVTDAAALRLELERRATTDALTGCLNRAAVIEVLERTLRAHVDRPGGTAVMFYDLDGFKQVNDTFGHAVGDQLLAAVAGRLQASTRDRDVVGRLGGDEFIVVATDVDTLDEAEQLAARTKNSLGAEFDVGGIPIHVGSSVGVSWASGADVTAEGLLAAADRAMYRAKRSDTPDIVPADVV